MSRPTIEEAENCLETARSASENLYALISRALSMAFIEEAKATSADAEIAYLKEQIASSQAIITEQKKELSFLAAQNAYEKETAARMRQVVDECHMHVHRVKGPQPGKTLLELLREFIPLEQK